MEIVKGFFVLEGLDGAGTTTQINMIQRRFRESNIPSYVTAEPTTDPVGRFIRSVLSGEVRVTPNTLAHLFAADRCNHIEAEGTGILAQISAGKPVFCDRYVFSSLAYQSIDCGFDYVATLNSEFPLPEVVFFLEVSTNTAMKRSEDRGELEIFETRPFQSAVSESYERALKYAESCGVMVCRLDGTRSPEEIHQAIWQVICDRLIEIT